nr:type II secretion system secretin GspD [Lysobacter sp. CAU 1642]
MAEALGGEAAQPASADDERPIESKAPGSGSFINQQAAARVPPPAGNVGEVTFNFEGESLHAVVKTILGEILQQNYVIAPGVSGTVTFSTAKPLRGDQALSILEMLLRWNNATLVWQDGRYTILPIAQALPGNLTPRTGSASTARGYEVRAVPLQYISALEMEKVLKPYAKPEAIVNIDPARNMIVLGGTREELQNYLQTVEIFDVDWLAGMSVGMYSLQQTEAAKVVTELEKIFGEGGQTPISGMFRFIPLEGVNGVMVITPQPKYLATIEEWLQRFDLGSGEAGQRLYVYDVKNVKAVDLADTLNEVFGSGGGSRSGRSSGGVAPGLQPVRIGSAGSRNAGQPIRGGDAKQDGGGGAGAGAGGGDDSGGGRSSAGSLSIGGSEDVRISAVEEGNALLVRATAAQWESIRRVIERMDAVPLQVAIEAQIISVSLTDELQYGVRWFFENAITDQLFGEGARDLAANRRIWGDLAGSISNGSTSWTLVGPNIGALVNIVDKLTDVRVLSAPSLVVLNNKAASINSGTQIPVTTTSINLGTGGTNTPIASTQYVQTGITLNVTPRVNPGGLVFLEIDQEDSSAGAIPEGGGNPPISQSTIQTEIAVQSGETVLLGGLIKQTDSKGSSGFPGLSRIPLVGGLFGNQSRNVARQELLVLITPKVIAGPQDTRAITDEYKKQFRALTPLRRLLPTDDASTQ